MNIFSVGQKVLINEEHNRRYIEGTVIAIPKKNTIVYDNDIIGNPDFMIEWTPDYCDNAENECSINKKAKEKHTIKYNNQLKYFVRMDNGLINLVFDEYIRKGRIYAASAAGLKKRKSKKNSKKNKKKSKKNSKKSSNKPKQ